MEAASFYYLDSAKLNDAIEIVKQELRVLNLFLRNREESQPRIRIATYLLFAGFASLPILFSHGWLTARMVLLGFAIFIVGLSCISFLGGWRALVEKRHLRETQRILGLEPDRYVGFVGWNEFALRFKRGATKILVYVAGVACATVGIYLRKFWISDFGFALVGLGCAMFVVFVAGRELQRFRRRVELTKELLDSLVTQQAALEEGSTISIPKAQYKEIARIERALVNLDRQKAISRRAKSLQRSARAVQQSTSVIAKKSTMEPFVRAMVQTKIDELSTNPRPAGSRQEPDGNIRLPVVGTFWEISYILVENPQRILIQDLVTNGK